MSEEEKNDEATTKRFEELKTREAVVAELLILRTSIGALLQGIALTGLSDDARGELHRVTCGILGKFANLEVSILKLQ